MKKTILPIVAMLLMVFSFAQTESLVRPPSLGFGIGFKDFITPSNIKATSVSHVISSNEIAKPTDNGVSPYLYISYTQGLTKHIDFMGSLSGCFNNYAYGNPSYQGVSDEAFLVDLDANLNFKLLSDKYCVIPYLTGGLGASLYSGTYLLGTSNAGAGIQFHVFGDHFIYLQSTYKFGLTNYVQDNFNYSIGFTAPLRERKIIKAKATPEATIAYKVPIVLDSDGDGVLDIDDSCPKVPGSARFHGCPLVDTDGDGIFDLDDSCPTVKGFARYHGCPIPDTDGDGVNDEEDLCPNVKGVARYHGCPIPDTDGDGINDDEDSCPTVRGVAENHGCPEIQTKLNELAKNVYFGTGSSVITLKTKKSLDAVTTILTTYLGAKLSIEGYTDNLGNPQNNKNLSQKRADAIMNYFVKNKIDANRLTATGYGPEKPIGDNKTADGRSKNRRVELKASY